ncbi:hypothetical protein MHSWG343_10410 [Candidatus Mycoplasma haematohominis]|uniref:Uncharacterized protein n=1 Tax=Candidatus Mycoplasma haematohominis TaxID=1494318 RepID=A0A478FR97_9MOLU|nr:hypothetical protein MHSWG343_10410 [Candidatus Mycoplasma haemohominis]
MSDTVLKVVNISSLFLKTAAGSSILSGGTIGAIKLKDYLQNEDFLSSPQENEHNRSIYTFGQILKTLKPTTAKTYDDLDETSKTWWRGRFTAFYKNGTRIRSKRFNELINLAFQKVWSEAKKSDDSNTLTSKVQNFEGDSQHEFMKNFYKECKDISELVLTKNSHPRHWKKVIKEFLTKVTEDEDTTSEEEREMRYLRDAWVACSASGSTPQMEIYWPNGETIKNKELNVWNTESNVYK